MHNCQGMQNVVPTATVVKALFGLLRHAVFPVNYYD